jgi:hypothetical protein
MFDKTYEDRLRAWHDFRKTLETSNDPIQSVIDKYQEPPRVSLYTDPWTPSTWPSPWELIEENQYCEFCNLLGICYSLQLTDKFSQVNFEIHIGIDDKNSSTHYLLYVDDFIIGYEDDTYIHKSKLPSTIRSQQTYPMQPLN